jgi:hypothetical protein
MATLNEISFNILNKLSGGRSTHNDYISLDQIKFNVNYYRALLLHRDLKKTVLEEFSFFQRLVIEFSEIEEQFYKSNSKIPPIVRLDHRFPLYVEDDEVIPVTISNRMRYQEFSSFTKNNPISYLSDGFLYIKNIDLEDLIIRGIFENPSEAYILGQHDPEKVDDLPYPCSSDLVQRISQSLINGDLEIILQTPNDTKHNTVPDHQIGR